LTPSPDHPADVGESGAEQQHPHIRYDSKQNAHEPRLRRVRSTGRLCGFATPAVLVQVAQR
jgi:hypothetical protein